MKRMTQTPELLTEKQNGTGVITLNRPGALNALSLPMIRGIRSALQNWAADPDVHTVVFTGAGNKAFCAGGDVKAVYEAGIFDRNTDLAREYFAEEYQMNREIFHFPKKTVAIMDGITMGGGFGVAGPCKIRIATENTVFAMPEVGIGLFPDVGSMYALTRVPDRLGHWLALTGEKVTGLGMMASGLATHFVMSNDIHPNDINGMLEKAQIRHDLETETKQFVSEITSRCFNFKRVEDVLDCLNEDKSDFALQTVSLIRSKCPTSVKLTHAYFQKMMDKSFNEVTAMDYRLAIRCMMGDEFYEGIRAQLIDKDKNPQWNPARLEDVSEEVIEAYFNNDLPDLDSTL